MFHTNIQKREYIQTPRELLSFIQRKLLGYTLFTVVKLLCNLLGIID